AGRLAARGRPRVPHCRDPRPEPALAQSEHVRVALDDQCPLLPGDRRPRAIEPVEQVALAEELPLRGVDVLRLQWIVLAEPARLEADDAGACVCDRKQQASLEVVVAAPVEEPGCGQLLPGKAA